MRNLPHKRNPKQEVIIKAAFDFYGPALSKAEMSKAKAVALHLMGRKKGIALGEEQMNAVWHIRQNLKDKTYTQSLAGNAVISR